MQQVLAFPRGNSRSGRTSGSHYDPRLSRCRYPTPGGDPGKPRPLDHLRACPDYFAKDKKDMLRMLNKYAYQLGELTT